MSNYVEFLQTILIFLDEDENQDNNHLAEAMMAADRLLCLSNEDKNIYCFKVEKDMKNILENIIKNPETFEGAPTIGALQIQTTQKLIAKLIAFM